MFIFFNRMGVYPDFAQKFYLDSLGSSPFMVIFGVVSLTYTPHYLDILPLYIVLLSFIPVFAILRLAGKVFPILASVGLWGASQAGLNLPGDPWGVGGWYFNPFAYQLIFFVGAAFALGWLQRPRVTNLRFGAAVVVLLACVPFSNPKLLMTYPELSSVHQVLAPLIDKSNFGILRLVHFLAAAYVAVAVVETLTHRYANLAVRRMLATFLARLRSHSLGVFVIGSFLSQLFGVFVVMIDPTRLNVAMLNLVGLFCLLASSEILIWFLSAPWKQSQSIEKPSMVIDFANILGPTAYRNPLQVTADLRSRPARTGSSASAKQSLIASTSFRKWAATGL